MTEENERYHVQECLREAVKILDALYTRYGHGNIVYIDTKIMFEVFEGSEFLKDLQQLTFNCPLGLTACLLEKKK